MDAKSGGVHEGASNSRSLEFTARQGFDQLARVESSPGNGFPRQYDALLPTIVADYPRSATIAPERFNKLMQNRLDKLLYPRLVGRILHIVEMSISRAKLQRTARDSRCHFALGCGGHDSIVRSANDKGRASNSRRDGSLIKVNEVI
jgi:hypothetical protein